MQFVSIGDIFPKNIVRDFRFVVVVAFNGVVFIKIVQKGGADYGVFDEVVAVSLEAVVEEHVAKAFPGAFVCACDAFFNFDARFAEGLEGFVILDEGETVQTGRRSLPCS